MRFQVLLRNFEEGYRYISLLLLPRVAMELQYITPQLAGNRIVGAPQLGRLSSRYLDYQLNQMPPIDRCIP